MPDEMSVTELILNPSFFNCKLKAVKEESFSDSVYLTFSYKSKTSVSKNTQYWTSYEYFEEEKEDLSPENSNTKMNVRRVIDDPAGYMDGLNLYAAYFGVNGVDPDGLSTIGDYAKRLNKLETQRKELGDTYYYTTRKALYGRIVRLIRTYNAVTNSLSDDKERLNDFLSSFPSVEYYDDSHKTFKSLKSSVLRRASVQTSLNLGLYVVTLGTANKMKAVSTTVKAAEKTSGFLKNSLKANLPYVVFNSSYAGLSSLAQGDEMGLAFKKAGFAALVTTGLRPLILKATPGVSVSVSVEEWIRESILAAVTQFTTKVTFDGWKETLSLKGGVSVFVAAVGGGATKILGTGTITASGFNWTMRLSSTGDAALGVGVGIVLIPVDNYLQNLVD